MNKCQTVECVSKVQNSGIMNAIILEILEKLKSFCLGNQQSGGSGDRLKPDTSFDQRELKIISTLYLRSTLFFHRTPSTLRTPSPGEGGVEGEL